MDVTELLKRLGALVTASEARRATLWHAIQIALGQGLEPTQIDDMDVARSIDRVIRSVKFEDAARLWAQEVLGRALKLTPSAQAFYNALFHENGLIKTRGTFTSIRIEGRLSKYGSRINYGGPTLTAEIGVRASKLPEGFERYARDAISRIAAIFPIVGADIKVERARDRGPDYHVVQVTYQINRMVMSQVLLLA